MMAALTAERERRASNTAKVVGLFRANQGHWIDSRELEKAGGRLAWRTRIAEARRIFCQELGWPYPIPKGGRDPITNQQSRILTFDEATGHCTQVEQVISEYRYLPYESLGRSADVPVPDHWPAFDAPIQETFRLT